jgi:hypothetical protein
MLQRVLVRRVLVRSWHDAARRTPEIIRRWRGVG